MTTTKRKTDRYAIQQYLLDCISTEGRDVTANTDKERLEFLISTFKSEYCLPEKLKYYGGNTQAAFVGWLQGLPSACTIDFENYEIIRLCKGWGILPDEPTDRQVSNCLERYWPGLYMALLALLRKHQLLNLLP